MFSGYTLVETSARTGSGSIQLGTLDANAGRLDYSDAGATNFYIDNTYNQDSATTKIRMKTAGTAVDAIVIKGSGNVGIGVTDPDRLFHVEESGGDPIALFEDATQNANVVIRATAANKNSILHFGDAASDEIGRIDYDHNDNSLSFVTNAAKAVRITSDGGIYEVGGVLKENLLTNSGFDVWSNSTLVEATSGAAPVLDGANAALVNNLVTNGGFDSATTGWTSAGTETSDSNGKTGYGLKLASASGVKTCNQNVTVVVGKLYQFSVYSDQGDVAARVTTEGAFVYDSGDFTPASDFSTQHTFVFEAITTTLNIYLHVRATGYTYFDSCTLYEVTPGCVAADALAMDGWYKETNNDVYRQHNDGGTLTKDGSFYSLKIVFGGAGSQVLTPGATLQVLAEHTQRFAGRTVTMGAWVKSDTADRVHVRLYDGSTSTASDSNAGTGWEWLEATATISASATNFRCGFRSDNAGSTTYISQPMLVFGSSIGEGNYTRPQGEIVWFEEYLQLTDYDGTTTVSSNTGALNIEAQSEGKIPKGVRAVDASLIATADGDAESIFTYDGTNTNLRGNWGMTQSPDGYVSTTGFQQCDSNGDFGIGVDATFTEVRLRCYGVQLR